MAIFRQARVVTIACFLMNIIPSHLVQIEADLPSSSLIYGLFNQFIVPLVQSLKKPEGISFRKEDLSAEETEAKELNINDVISSRISELRDVLQDKTVHDNDTLRLEGNGENTILQVPYFRTDNKEVKEKTHTIVEKIEKFKTLRKKIYNLLNKEKVKDGTKVLITKTLDALLGQLISHQCPLNSTQFRSHGVSSFRTGVSGVVDSWRQLFEQFKKEYLMLNNEKDYEHMFYKFEALFNLMTEDVLAIAKNFKIVCHFINMYRLNEEKALSKKGGKSRSDDTGTDLGIKTEILHLEDEDIAPCANFKVCSDELKSFMNNFYTALNTTYSNSINNYAAMFLKDVSDDGYHEKERVVELIRKTIEPIKVNVADEFVKQTRRFNLERSGNPYANMRHIYRFITRTIDASRKSIFNILPSNLKSISEKLMENIRKDIDANLAIDLASLEKEISGTVCPHFEVCNKMYYDARKGGYVGDKNNIYVKVQLDLDNMEELRSYKQTTYENIKILISKSPVNVTRTTPKIHHLVQADVTGATNNDYEKTKQKKHKKKFKPKPKSTTVSERRNIGIYK